MATTVRSRTSASKRQHESEDESDVESGISSDEEIEETPEEKRLRLASIYLEEIQRKEEEARETVTTEDLNARLRHDELEQSQKLFRLIANKFQSFGQPSFHKDKIHNKPLTCLVVNSRSTEIFTASKDGSIVKWTFSSDQSPKMSIRKKSAKQQKGQQTPSRCHESTINCMAINFEDTFLATGDDSNKIFIWKSSTLELVKVFQGHRGPVNGLTFAKNKNILYSCSRDRSVKTWDLDQMGYVETLFGHQDSVSCITSGITCDFLTGGGKDGTVRIWKTADEVQLVFNHPQSASVEALEKINAEYFTTISDNGQICVWSSRKKTPLCSKFQAHGIDPTNDTARWLTALAVLNCADLMATGSYDGFLRLWKIDPKTKSIQPVQEYELKGFINSISFTSDGKFLLVAVGQEHKCGRWWSIKETKNQLVCFPLNFETE